MILNENIERKGNIYPAKIIDYKKELDTLYFNAENGIILQLTVLRDSVIRFRYTTTNKFEDDFSYAIVDEMIDGYNVLDIQEEEDKYVVITEKVFVFRGSIL